MNHLSAFIVRHTYILNAMYTINHEIIKGIFLFRNMAEQRGVNWLKTRITCSECSSILDQPTTLPCLHNLCSQCITELPLLNNGPKSGYLCPVCKEFCDKKHMQRNVLLTELVDMYDTVTTKKVALVCKQCKDALPSIRCTECKADLCEPCKAFHDGFELLKPHHSVSVADSQNDVVIDRFIFCPTHSKKLIEHNCVPCETPICSMCKATDHDGHKCESTEDALKRILPEIKDIQAKIHYSSQAVSTKREHISRNAANVCSTIEAMEKEVIDAYEEIRQKINSDLASLLDKLRTMKQRVRMQEMTCSDVVDKHLDYSSRLVTWVDTITTMATGTSLLYELQSGVRTKVRSVAEQLAQSQESLVVSTIVEDCSSKLIFEPAALTKENIIGRIDERKSGLWPFCVKDLCTFQPTHVAEIALQCHPNLYFSLVRGQIWIPTQVNYQGCIMVYSVDGSYYNTLKIPGVVDTPRAVVEWKSYAQARNKTLDAVVASNTGLFAISAEGELLETIHDGNFYNVCTCGDRLYALEYNTHQVYTFQHKYGVWNNLKTLQLTKLKHSKYNQLANTLQVYNGDVYVYIWGFDTVYRYNMDGVLIGQYGGEGKGGGAGRLYAGRLCGHDRTGTLLVCDRDNKRIQVLGADGKWSITCLKHLRFCPLHAVPVTRHVFWVLDTDRNMHVFKVN